MFVVVLFCLVTCIYLLLKLRKRSLEPPLASGAVPFLGHVLKGLNTPEVMFNYLKSYSMESIRREVPLTIQFLAANVYFITHPDEARTVLNSCLQKDITYEDFKLWLGEGLISGTETIWRKHRKILNPTFNQAVLDSYLSELNKQARWLVNQLAAKVGQEKFNHAPELEQVTLQSICSTALGVVIDDEDAELRVQYIRAMSRFSTGLVARAHTFWLQSDILYNWSGLRKKQVDLAETLHKLTKAIIEKRKEDLRLRQIERNPEKRFKPFLEHLLDMESDGVLDGTEVQEEVDTFTFAGADTLSVLLTTILLNVGSYPEVQRKIIEELQEIFQGSLRDVEKQDLLHMKYLEAVVKESLRLYPSVPLVGRTIGMDVKIGNYTLLSGSRCFVSLYGVNRHPSWGLDAEEFRPERWLDATSMLNNQFASFGFGKRRCIGNVFAIMTAKTILAHVLRHYQVWGDIKELVRTIQVVARPVPNEYITIERRKKTVPTYIG